MNPLYLVKWRKKNGYSQVKLSKELGVSVITVYRWEKGKREIPSFLHLALKGLEKEVRR
jgi:transcriptional regulator with XRE-family HTH domain